MYDELDPESKEFLIGILDDDQLEFLGLSDDELDEEILKHPEKL